MSSIDAKLAAALVKACAALDPALKNSTNVHLKNSYADLQAVQDAARKALSPNGLTWYQACISEGDKVGVHTFIVHTSGAVLDCGQCLMPVPQARNAAHAIGSILSYTRRYSLAAALGIHQADPDASLPDEKPQPKKRKTLAGLGLSPADVDAFMESKGKADRWATMSAAKRGKFCDWAESNRGKVQAC